MYINGCPQFHFRALVCSRADRDKERKFKTLKEKNVT
jgi:hypothetical protein